MTSTTYRGDDAVNEAERGLTIASIATFCGMFAFVVGFELPDTMLATDLSADRGSLLSPVVLLGSICVLVCVRLGTGNLSLPRLDYPLLALLAWCAVTLSWSSFQSVGTMRLVQTSLIPVFLLLALDAVGLRKALSVATLVLASGIVLSYAYLALLPGSVHLSNENDAALIGNWRGAYSHKNVAGGVVAISILFFVRKWTIDRSLVSAALIVSSVVFLWMTQSKTSIAILLLVAIVLGCMPVLVRNGAVSGLAVIGASTAAIVGALFLVANLDVVWGYASDREAFTGRGALWSMMATYVQGHAWTGSGFGSFWRVGVHGPTFVLSSGWGASSYNGHNGYMDALVTTGIPGLALMVFALVLVPLVRGTIRIVAGRPDAIFLTSVVVFVILQNLFETTFLMGSSPVWILFLLASLGLLFDERKIAEGNLFERPSDRKHQKF